MNFVINTIVDAFIDAFIDTLKLLPFLLVTYILMEYLEHKTSDKVRKVVSKAGKAGPVIGGFLGIIPQCGFSAAASSLYVGRVISLGTLMAIYLSTSDEMLPILIAERAPGMEIIKILAIKLFIGVIVGLIIDFLMRKKGVDDHEHIHEMCEHDHCHCGEGNILKSAFIHTMQIALFILAVNLVLNAIFEIVGESFIVALLENKGILGPIFASLIGLIPNCAGSVALTTLYIKGVLSLGSVIGGLLTGCGVGCLVLFRLNHDKKECFKILGMLYVIGVLSGIVVGLL